MRRLIDLGVLTQQISKLTRAIGDREGGGPILQTQEASFRRRGQRQQEMDRGPQCEELAREHTRYYDPSDGADSGSPTKQGRRPLYKPVLYKVTALHKVEQSVRT